MKAENVQFMESVYHRWVTLRDAGYLAGLSQQEKDGMLRVMREEFDPNHNPDLWCPSCLIEFMKQLFQRYDQWKQQNTITVAASFPSNK